jgi:mannosyltransferase
MTNTLTKIHTFTLFALIIILIASAVRFHNLGTQSLWYDEGVAYTHSLRTLPELVPLLQRNVHVPAYFGLLGLWEDVTGSSEFSLRMLSALFSILSVAWTYALGKRLFHPIVGLVAMALVALNTFSIYYAQETRMYAMLAAIAVASMWVYVGFLRHLIRVGANRAVIIRYGLALGLLNTVGIYTHVVYALVMLSQAVMASLWLLMMFYEAIRSEGKLNLRPTITAFLTYFFANLLTLILFSPWLTVITSQVFSQPNISDPVSLELVLRVLQGWFAFGNTFELSMGNMGFVVYFFLLFGLIWSPLKLQQKRAAWAMMLPVMWVLISVALYLYLELTTRYLRFLLPTQIAFALWMGRGVWVLWTRQTRERLSLIRFIPKIAAVFATGVFLLTLANGLEPLYSDPEFQRDDIRGLSDKIESRLQDGDAVLASAAGVEEILRYYYDAEAMIYALPTSPDDNETAQSVLDIISNHDRIYAVFYGTEEQDPNGIIESTLNSAAYEISEEWIGDMRFAQYASPAIFDDIQTVDFNFGDKITLQSLALSTNTVLAGDLLQLQLIWTVEETPDIQYKVFLQLLDDAGVLVAQRDSEPAGGLSPTTTWQSNSQVVDNHALAIPSDLAVGDYTLILGLYDIDNPSARLIVNDETYVEISSVRIQPIQE